MITYSHPDTETYPGCRGEFEHQYNVNGYTEGGHNRQEWHFEGAGLLTLWLLVYKRYTTDHSGRTKAKEYPQIAGLGKGDDVQPKEHDGQSHEEREEGCNRN